MPLAYNGPRRLHKQRSRAAAHCSEFRPLFENSAATDVPPPTMRARRAHDARTHDANTAPHWHANIVTAAARSLDSYMSAHAAAEACERRAMSFSPTRLRNCNTSAQQIARNKTASGHVSFGVGNLGIRWPLSIVVLCRQLLGPSDTYALSMRSISRAISVLFRPPRRRGAETTSRGPATVRSNETAQPKVPTPW